METLHDSICDAFTLKPYQDNDSAWKTSPRANLSLDAKPNKAHESGMAESIVEPSQNTANPSQTYQPDTLNDALPMVQRSPERKSWHFTPEKAREMQRKGIEARRKLKEDAEKAVQVMDELKEKAVLLPILQPDEAYRLNRLDATRKALDGLYSDLNGADDPKDQKAICDSIARLSEVERQLAGRPAPGSLRPAQAKTKRATPESYGPVE